MNKKNKTNVLVVIPTYNSWVTLKECIASIQKQVLKPLEIIVVDNNSSDGTTDKIRKIFPSINRNCNSKNLLLG